MKLRPLSRKGLFRIVWVLAAVALGLQPGEGADYPRYDYWVDVFASYDVLKLNVSTLSPVGVPVSHWSHAPALVANALDRLLGLLPFVKTGLHTASWLAALAFWWALIGLSRLVSKGDSTTLLLTLAVAYLGTHAGFYSVHHSSEIFALASFAVATYWALSAGPERVRDSVAIGIACGLLLIIRVNLVMYVPLPLATRALVVWRGHGGKWNKALLLHAAAFAVPLLAFGAQLPVFNYWMTGSAARNPYVYGGGGFRSVDWSHPLFGTTLFHSWHGLLSYHPLFALGAIALVGLGLSRSLPVAERVLAIGALAAMLAQLYMQASWWCWWLGRGTFGNRTLALGGLLGVVALARWLVLLLEPGASRARRAGGFILLGSMVAACTWSWLLYLQGPTNFHSWRELLSGQRALATDQQVFVPLGVTGLLAVGAALAWRTRWSRAVLSIVTAFVVAMAAHALFAEPLQIWCNEVGLGSLRAVLLSLLCTLAFAVVVSLTGDHDTPVPSQLARGVVGASLGWIFLCGSWTFVRLTLATRDVIKNSTAETQNYLWRSTMVVEDIVESVEEYEAVDGFQRRKRAANQFLSGVLREQSLPPAKPKSRSPHRKATDHAHLTLGAP